jgi:hypothetical protein
MTKSKLRGLLPALVLAIAAASPARAQLANAMVLSLEDLLEVTVTGAAKYTQNRARSPPLPA